MGDRRLTRWRKAWRQTPTEHRRGIGWAAATGSAALVMAGAAVLSGAGEAAADSALALGTSSAQSLQVTPHDGSLAVGAIFGSALAGVTGQDAKAQSQGVDLGAVGESMEADNCGQPPNSTVAGAVPQPLDTETGAPGASSGVSQSPSQSDYFADEYVLANGDPYGEADTTYAGPFSDPTGAIAISGMVSKAWAGVVSGVEETGASSDVSSVSLGNGAVVLDGLDWTTTSTESGQQSGSFTIGKVLVDGVALPDVADLSSVLSAVNSALSNLGLEIGFPSSFVQDGYQNVGPLQIEVVPNATRDEVEQAIVDGADPTYYQIANGLENGFSSDSSPYSDLGEAEQGNLGQDIMYGLDVNGNQLPGLCDSDTAITVGDVTIASMDGGGYFNIALGGVSSDDGALPANPFDLSALGLGNLSVGGTDQFVAGTPATPGSVGSPATDTVGSSGTTSSVPLHEAIRAQATGFSPGGSLLGAGLGGLGLLLLLVEGDRRLMRRAQRAGALSQPPTSGGAEA